jgi:hypothetical protein
MLVDSLELYASLSQRGVKGEVRFTGDEEGSGSGQVTVSVNLEVAEGSAGEYTWGIYEFPIDYTQVSLKNRLLPVVQIPKRCVDGNAEFVNAFLNINTVTVK